MSLESNCLKWSNLLSTVGDSNVTFWYVKYLEYVNKVYCCDTIFSYFSLEAYEAILNNTI